MAAEFISVADELEPGELKPECDDCLATVDLHMFGALLGARAVGAVARQTVVVH